MPFIAILLIVALFFFVPMLGAVFGALAGWIVGLFFSETILGILTQMGIETSMWEFGCFLGFVGGFFKTSITQNKN